MDKNNDTKQNETKRKLETIKSGLINQDKCKEFTEKLLQYISKEK